MGATNVHPAGADAGSIVLTAIFLAQAAACQLLPSRNLTSTRPTNHHLGQPRDILAGAPDVQPSSTAPSPWSAWPPAWTLTYNTAAVTSAVRLPETLPSRPGTLATIAAHGPGHPRRDPEDAGAAHPGGGHPRRPDRVDNACLAPFNAYGYPLANIEPRAPSPR